MKFEVDEKLVEPIIRDQIATAVIAQIGDPTALIRHCIEQTLKQKVSSNGTISTYSSENKFDFIEVLSANAIRAAAKAAVEKIAQDAAPQIEAEISRQIKAAPKKTAAAIMAGFMGLAGQPNNYRLTANFAFQATEN
ncbi:hypothetical protein CVO77_00400 [Sphingopyxis lindanitolerans]|uniref:Uncharacterized protein n=1 Tax=Sphingopyxis lindanitolerans TaxID=2054227 RepID=A0A2S8BAT8_9SPHN|nr:hypothetical protein [Sphingopyxis lindanitolerans]PQM29433.1 hypothetical protein CVO77_00400 [Sphingopyxis lindanitolerans]